jgi:hypothetical protein
MAVVSLLLDHPAGPWSDKPPEVEGWWWVWQPEAFWPCRGEVMQVRVAEIRGRLLAAPSDLADPDPVDSATWLRAHWLGPVVPPAPPFP